MSDSCLPHRAGYEQAQLSQAVVICLSDTCDTSNGAALCQREIITLERVTKLPFTFNATSILAEFPFPSVLVLVIQNYNTAAGPLKY